MKEEERWQVESVQTPFYLTGVTSSPSQNYQQFISKTKPSTNVK